MVLIDLISCPNFPAADLVNLVFVFNGAPVFNYIGKQGGLHFPQLPFSRKGGISCVTLLVT
jgi:hypothetical protein